MKTLTLASILMGLVALVPESCEGYRILGVFPFHGKSHFMMFEALMKGLARKGHQVDSVSPFPLKTPYPNYTDIIDLPLMTPGFVNNMTFQRFKSMSSDMVHFIATDAGNTICDGLGHPAMQKLIRDPPKDPPYDLMMTEIFGAHCFMALGHRLKVPVVGVSPTALYPWANGMVANPPNLAIVPNTLLNYVAPMPFWQRLHNTVSSVYNDFYFKYHSRPQDEQIKKYIGKDAPGVREAERSLALILTNSHPTLNGPKPITPAVVEVGGLHVRDNDFELTQDLKDWMDKSTAGFVYFTFGSMVVIESFPRQLIDVIYKSLGKIAPVRVLIKIPNPHLLPPGLPSNFRTFKWAPQYKVLKHKNIKAFVTHGGLMSTQEAIHCAVPMVGMPLFADQFINIDLYVAKKVAVKLQYEGITVEKMDAALKEILHNPVYKKTMDKLSTKFRDRPMTPVDTATWWIEYVIRNGADSLRSPAMDLSIWEIELFDVYAFIVLVAGLLVFLAIMFTKFLFKRLFGSKKTKATSAKKIR